MFLSLSSTPEADGEKETFFCGKRLGSFCIKPNRMNQWIPARSSIDSSEEAEGRVYSELMCSSCATGDSEVDPFHAAAHTA